MSNSHNMGNNVTFKHQQGHTENDIQKENEEAKRLHN